jgi:hypothetical protein
MKQTLFVLTCIVIFSACNNATKETATAKDSTSKVAVTLPYKVNYSSDFEIGDQKYAQIVLEAWKDYDNNTLEKSAGLFADSVTMDLANGATINTKRDSAIAIVAKGRGSLASATDYIDAITVLKPKGKDETWVCVWAKEVDVMKDGKKDSVFLNENWMLNKDGKIRYISQLEGKPPVKK